MEAALKTYFEKCQFIFNQHRSKMTRVVTFPGTSTHPINHRQLFEKAIKDAEDTEEFEAFVIALQAGPLSSDIERLTKKEKRRRKKTEKKHRMKSRNFDKWRKDTARQAARGFFRNTGAYVNLWQGSDVEKSNLFSILDSYNEKKDSEFIRFFVFDGFVPFHNKKQLNHVSLPMGELKKYTEKELEEFLRIPQSFWHRNVNPDIIKKAAIWHILTVREKDEYRGMTGIWLNDALVSPIGWSDIGEPTKKEGDIGIIGPIFLCIGEDANLAVEIRVRTNIFEYSPIYQKVRNDYLPWDSYDEEGEPKPRTWIKYIGEDGNKLRKVCEIWQNINALDADGHLRYPTEAYVRSVMNLHISWEGLMETFVGFVTVIESLLTPGTRQELTYKTAVRGASILDSDPENRIGLFHVLDEFYKIRSQIVHEGRTEKDDPYELNNMISHNLTEISRQIFLRYICLLYLTLNGDLPEWVLADSEKLSSRNSRPKTIAHILDSLVLDPNLTNQLEKRMEEWGVYDDWKRRIGLRLSGKRPEK
ncbi:MAG: hypothetical protein KAV87_52400 [Desulfobacteraceae bacterium]|nr:hypothetical protein [Desulfobacteraceae bacterium]